MKKLIIFILFGILFTEVHAASALENKCRSEIERALAKTGKTITCSPYGRVPGTLSFEDAAKKLRGGMVLRMMPGNYNPQDLVIFDQSSIIIEGDGSNGYVYAPLILYGKKCIVRNIKVYTLEVEDATVVNTFTHTITVTNGSKRGRCLFYNCAANYLSLYTHASDITFLRCTFLCGAVIDDAGKVHQTATYTTHRAGLYSSIGLHDMTKKGKLTFDSCILYTNGHLFSRDAKMLELKLDNNIIHCGRSLKSPAKDKPEVKTLSGLKEFFDLDKSNKSNQLTTPKFKKEPNKDYNWDIATDNFILLPNSPGFEKIGVNMGTNGIPIGTWQTTKK